MLQPHFTYIYMYTE